MGGWIKLYRELLDKPMWKTFNSNHKVVWLTILMMANHEPKTVTWGNKTYDLAPGQFISTYNDISLAADPSGREITPRVTLRSLLALEFGKTIRKKRAGNGILITIEKWAFFQGDTESAVRPEAESGQTCGKTWRNTSVRPTGILPILEEEKKEEEYIKARTRAHAYGEFENVHLSDEEFEKLMERFPDYEERIERLSAYKRSKGKSYKSDYATILNWARKDDKETAQRSRYSVVDDFLSSYGGGEQ